jgi:hypothetical protein
MYPKYYRGSTTTALSRWLEKDQHVLCLGMFLVMIIALGSLFVWGAYFQWIISGGGLDNLGDGTISISIPAHYQQDHIFFRNEDNGCIFVQVIPHRCEIDGKRKRLRLLPRSDIDEIILFPEFADIQDEKLCHIADQRMIVFLSPRHIYEVYQTQWFNESFSNVTFQYERNQLDGFFPLSERSFIWSHVRDIHSVLFFPDKLIWRGRQRGNGSGNVSPSLSYIHEEISNPLWLDEQNQMYKPKPEIIQRHQSLEYQWRPFFFLLVILATIFRSTCPSSEFFRVILLSESLILFVIYLPTSTIQILWFLILWGNTLGCFIIDKYQQRIIKTVEYHSYENQDRRNLGGGGGGEYPLLQYLIYWIGYRKENTLFGLFLSLFFYYMSIYQMKPGDSDSDGDLKKRIYFHVCTILCGIQSFVLYFLPWMGYGYTYPSELVSVRWFFVFYIACSVVAWRKQYEGNEKAKFINQH